MMLGSVPFWSSAKLNSVGADESVSSETNEASATHPSAKAKTAMEMPLLIWRWLASGLHLLGCRYSSGPAAGALPPLSGLARAMETHCHSKQRCRALATKIEKSLVQVGYHEDEAAAISRRLSSAEEDETTSRTELTARLKARARLGGQGEVKKKPVAVSLSHPRLSSNS